MKYLFSQCGLLFLLATALFSASLRDDGWRYLIAPSQIQVVEDGLIRPAAEGRVELANPAGYGLGLTGCAALIRFPLSEIAQTDSQHAVIWWPFETVSDGFSACIGTYRVVGPVDERIEAAQLIPISRRTVPINAKGPLGLSVTAGASAFLKQNEAVFLIRLEGAPGSTQAVTFDGNAWLAVAKQEHPATTKAALLLPLWNGETMINETLLPTRYDGGAAVANLRFEPESVLSVRNYALDTVYREGVDYAVEGRTLRVLPGSPIPSLAYEQLYTDDSNAKPRVGRTLDGKYLIMTEEPFFNAHQLAVTYRTAEAWKRPVPQSAGIHLPRTFSILEADKTLRLVVFGDSISAGASASSHAARAPFMPRWTDLLATALESHYPGEVALVNASLGGMRSDWGRQHAAALVAHERPDLVVLGFGMNDAGANFSVETFVENTQAMMAAIRTDNPEVEFLLLMSFQPNAAWRDLDLMASYLPALQSLEGPGVAVADLWTPHGYLLEGKTYWDMTGNHVNHPNDFLVRLYAQVILARLGVEYNPDTLNPSELIVSPDSQSKPASESDYQLLKNVHDR